MNELLVSPSFRRNHIVTTLFISYSIGIWLMQQFSISPKEIVGSFWRNRSLMMTLVKREVIGRYRGSVMGMLWSFFNPILMLAVYTFVFSVVFKARWVGGSESKTEFALVLFAGLMVFNLFSECINRAPGLVLGNMNSYSLATNRIVRRTNLVGDVSYLTLSRDDRKLAFAYYTDTGQGEPVAEVYIIDRDGKGLKQVYRGTTVGAVLFSPDGTHLLIGDTTSATGRRLFTVDLETLEQRLLLSPGLSLDTDWDMPSWRR